MFQLIDFIHNAFSYSFNSPDGTTYLPIRGAHVFGIQVVYRLPQMVKPLIPLIESVESIINNQD
ncbi:MAG: hypothetical protein WCX28_14670 [Bacteriovoracaceae bacterium]|nr:hypothetical protein [Bacteroidota bacterium]